MKLSIKSVLFAIFSVFVMSVNLSAQDNQSVQDYQSDQDYEWPHYANNQGSSKYADLDQINRDTVQDLKVTWVWDSVDNAQIEVRPLPTSGEPVHSPLSQAVILCSLLLVGQHMIGLVDFLELLLGLLVTGIHIGMILAGEPAERRLDLALAGVRFYPEHVIQVSPHPWPSPPETPAGACSQVLEIAGKFYKNPIPGAGAPMKRWGRAPGRSRRSGGKAPGTDSVGGNTRAGPEAR